MDRRYGAQAANGEVALSAQATVSNMDTMLEFIRPKLTTMEWFLLRTEILELIYHERQDALANYTNTLKNAGVFK